MRRSEPWFIWYNYAMLLFNTSARTHYHLIYMHINSSTYVLFVIVWCGRHIYILLVHFCHIIQLIVGFIRNLVYFYDMSVYVGKCISNFTGWHSSSKLRGLSIKLIQWLDFYWLWWLVNQQARAVWVIVRDY